MIPKIIHYCWFGRGSLPESAQKCIESWKKYCPDYEIKEWNESNFDVSACNYSREAYELKKWAFVSDYARFWILQQYGGIYLDTDVELIKGLDNLLNNNAYMGIERSYAEVCVAPGLGCAAEPHNHVIESVVKYYEGISFQKDGRANTTETVCHHVTGVLKKIGFEQADRIQHLPGITIYPSEFFCPQDLISREIEITENTYSIHHYDGSWYSEVERYSHKLRKKMPKWVPYRTAGRISHFIAQCKYNGIYCAVCRTWNRLREL